MTDRPEIQLALKVTGHGFSPEEFTRLVNFQPTRTWRTGDQVLASLLKRKNDAWVLDLPPRNGYDLEEVLREFLEKMEPFRERLIEAADNLKLDRELSFGIYIRERPPAGSFTADTIRQIAALGASLDIDIILLPSGGDDDA